MAKQVAFTDQAKADLRAILQPMAIQMLRTLARFLDSEEVNVKKASPSSSCVFKTGLV